MVEGAPLLRVYGTKSHRGFDERRRERRRTPEQSDGGPKGEVQDGPSNPSLLEQAAEDLRKMRYRRDGRAVEGAPLLRVYTPKAYRGFKSLSLRQ